MTRSIEGIYSGNTQNVKWTTIDPIIGRPELMRTKWREGEMMMNFETVSLVINRFNAITQNKCGDNGSGNEMLC